MFRARGSEYAGSFIVSVPENGSRPSYPLPAPALVPLGVLHVPLEIPEVLGGDAGVPLDDEDVLRVLLLRRLREVEAPGDDRFPVDQDDLVVGDRVLVVDVRRDPA